jgi:hypothetical protein
LLYLLHLLLLLKKVLYYLLIQLHLLLHLHHQLDNLVKLLSISSCSISLRRTYWRSISCSTCKWLSMLLHLYLLHLLILQVIQLHKYQQLLPTPPPPPPADVIVEKIEFDPVVPFVAELAGYPAPPAPTVIG